MAQIVTVKCPQCSAPLPVQADMQSVTCRYCGSTAMVDRGGGRTHAPGGTTVVRIPPASTAPGVGPLIGIIVAVGVLVAGAGALFVRSDDRPVQAVAPSGTVPVAGDPSAAQAPAPDFDDRPMLADVNGDAVLDVVGHSRKYELGDWIAAYDGRDGKELWRTTNLTSDATDGSAVRGVVLGRVLSIDSLGKVQAYDLRSGQPAWSTLLGERAKAICEGENTIVVQTTDDQRHGLDPARGSKSALAKDAPCKPIYSSDRDSAPTYKLIGWWDFEKHGLPNLHSTEGISAHRALVPNADGPRFLLGSRDKGTAVAMVAAVEGHKKPLWMDVVPGVDPLTTTVNVTVQQAAWDPGILVIPYALTAGGMRMACFDPATGTRQWDVQIHKTRDITFIGLAISGEHIYISSWSALHVFSRKNGEPVYTIGDDA